MSLEEMLVRERDRETPNPLLARSDEIVARVRRRRRNRAAAVGVLSLATTLVVVALVWQFVVVPRSDPLPAGPPAASATVPAPRPTATGPDGAPVVQAEVLAEIAVGTEPQDVERHAMTGDLYVSNSGQGTVSVIDPSSRTVVATVPVGTSPSGIAVDEGGPVYVANSDTEGVGTVSVIDPTTREVVGTITIGAGKWPVELAVDPEAGALFVSNNGDGTVSVVDTGTLAVVQTIPVGRSPVGIAVDPAAGRAYVMNGNSGSVSVIDTRARRVVGTVEGVGGGQVALVPSRGLLLLAAEATGTVEVVDTTTLEVVRVISVGGRYGPFGVEVDEPAGRAYVSGGRDGALAVIDLDTLNVVELIAARAEPWYGLAAVDPVTDTLYLAAFDGTVTVMPRR